MRAVRQEATFHRVTRIRRRRRKFTGSAEKPAGKMNTAVSLGASGGMLLLVVLVFHGSGAFNIDTAHPIAFNGPERSYFGYAVSLLTNSQGSWLVAGAPRANSSYPKHQGIVEPGVIFRCDVGDHSRTCTSIVMDKSGNGVPVIMTSDLKYKDLKDGMWLGVSVDTTAEEGGRLVACAHRWRNQFYRGHHLMNGVCYTMDREFDDRSVQKLLPLVSGKQQILRSNEYKYAAGQSGISAQFVKNSDALLLGAPGIFDWKGSVVLLSRADSGIISKRSTLQSYAIPSIPNPEALIEYGSYLGYSVTSGKFHENGQIHYAIGSPRNNYKGTVFIYNIKNSEFDLDSKIERHGEQMGEYFGASVLAVDVTNDGLDDLLVGAPLHSIESDEGKVYVYINKGSARLQLANEGLVGSKVRGGRFGTSMAGIGDVNMDGHQDVAIGAPYENNKGAVYIYHGTSNGLRGQAQQRILAEEASPTATGFGISLSRGVDIDGNNYPDLAIGAYDSDEAFVFRSRPLVYLTGSLKPDQNKINMDRRDCSMHGKPVTCFHVSASLQYTGKHVPSTLRVRITLEVDTLKTNQTNTSRVLIRLPTDKAEPVIQIEETLNVSETWSQIYEIHAQDRPRDVMTPIQLKMHYELVSTENPSDFCATCPMIDKSQPNFAFTQVRYQKNCGDDDRCDSDLHLKASVKDYTPGNVLVIGRDNKFVLQMEVSNTMEPAYATTVSVDIPPWLDIDQRPPACEFVLQDRHTFQCMIANPLKANNPATLELHLNIQHAPVQNGELVLNISTTSDSNEGESQLLDNQAVIKMPLKVEADMFVIGVPLNEQIFYDHDEKGNVKEMTTANFSHVYEVVNAGPSLVNLATVQLNFPSRSLDGEINFLEITGVDRKDGARGAMFGTCEGNFGNAKTPMVIPDVSGETLEPVDDNPVTTTIPSRRRRNVGESAVSSQLTNSTGDEATQLKKETMAVNCDTTICDTITCTVGPFAKDARVTITLSASVHVHYLKRLMGKKEMANIFTSAQVYINSTTDIQPEFHESDIATVSSELKPSGPPLPKEIAPWIIPVSIIGGLLLLVLITTAMVKTGFFRRQKKEEMERLMHGEQNSSLINANSGNSATAS